MNSELSKSVIQELVLSGVEEFVVCPGSRNSPLMQILLGEKRLKVHFGFEERASAFFALGRARREARPCAVVTTSGTAVGELLPAAMEAYYTGIPLVLLTADRPRRLRDTNAPQTANQKNIFGLYADFYDLEGPEKLSLRQWSGSCPLHLNICLDEPEKTEAFIEPLDLPVSRLKVCSYAGDYTKIESFLKHHDPLVIVSALPVEAKEPVRRFLFDLKAPVYPEATSHLREENTLEPFRVMDPDFKRHTSFLRIGGIPTHRLWRDIEEQPKPTLSISEHPFPGLSGQELITAHLPSFFKGYTPYAKGQKGYGEPKPFTPEEKIIHQLSKAIPESSLIYLGNSLPIREWDAAATREDKKFKVVASRGLNGIDGQISTFFGLAEKGRLNVAILGDLTALYDSSAPWLLPDAPFTLVILNNKGGRIFEKMYPFKEMINAHSITFEYWAKQWKLSYLCLKTIPPFLPKIQVLEIDI